MYGVRHVFAVKDAALDVALGKYPDLFRKLKLLERLYQVEAAAAIRLRHALELTLDENGREGAIFAELMLPPANGKVAAERLAVVEIGSDHRRFKIEAKFHSATILLFGRDNGHDCDL